MNTGKFQLFFVFFPSSTNALHLHTAHTEHEATNVKKVCRTHPPLGDSWHETSALVWKAFLFIENGGYSFGSMPPFKLPCFHERSWILLFNWDDGENINESASTFPLCPRGLANRLEQITLKMNHHHHLSDALEALVEGYARYPIKILALQRAGTEDTPRVMVFHIGSRSPWRRCSYDQ